MSNHQLAKIAFVIAFLGVLFSMSPFLGNLNFGTFLFGTYVSVKFSYYMMVSVVGICVYFYALGFAYPKAKKLAYIVGDYLFSFTLILPPALILSWVFALKFGNRPVLSTILYFVVCLMAGAVSFVISQGMRKKEGAGLMGQPITAESLKQYSIWRFPELCISDQWHSRIIDDIEKANLTEKIITIRDIEDCLKKAEKAVLAHKKENPDFFKTSTDHITKSLGFCFDEFRRVHKFGQTTREAFKKYKDLVVE